jgi:hypothetical protein
MPRCTSKVSPELSATSRYLPRRPIERMVYPVSRATKSAGNGFRRSGRRIDPLSARSALQHPADRFDLGEFGHVRILMGAERAEDAEFFSAGIAGRCDLRVEGFS